MTLCIISFIFELTAIQNKKMRPRYKSEPLETKSFVS